MYIHIDIYMYTFRKRTIYIGRCMHIQFYMYIIIYIYIYIYEYSSYQGFRIARGVTMKMVV